MADNLCGPSNALQNFQKHSAVDRTLQQDRFISRPSPSQGFRSSPGPNAGLLDPEFEAFQAGQLPLEPHQPAFQQFSHTPPPQLQQPVAGPSSWANDFQRLNISTPPAQFQPAQRSPLHQAQDGGSWHQDFRQQFQQQQGLAPAQRQDGLGSQFAPMMSGGMGMHAGMQPQFMGGMANSQMNREPRQAPEAFDDAAFARAFEDAAKAEMDKEAESQSQSQEARQAAQEIQLDQSAELLMSEPPALDEAQATIPDQARIGADLIHNPSDTPEPQPEDPDALARTAGQLLESVRGNTSQKFQNSEFLQLMRQFRDREVQVEGDKIVDRATGRDNGVHGDEGPGGVPEAIQVQP